MAWFYGQRKTATNKIMLIDPKHDLEEHELWLKYPQHHKWWNKLYLAETMGYVCGPGSVPIPETREYVIRPIYNLAGMGLFTTITTLQKDDVTSVPPGYFWCEYLQGNHYSVTYERQVHNEWKVLHCWQGFNHKENVIKFYKWIRSDYAPKIPHQLTNLIDVPYINVEYKGNNPFEVHFRPSGNPDGTYDSPWNEYIPIWESTTQLEKDKLLQQGYKWIDNPFENWDEDIEPYMKEKRLGYYVR